jgi:hypothetical protein
MDLITALLGATGLAAAAGLNAYIPLLLISTAARYLPGGWFVLSPQFEFVRSNWFFGLVLFLLVVEILADKIPIVDHVNDVIQTIIRPAAGAVLFAAGTGVIAHIDPWLAMGLGFVAAGSVHGVKMAFRPLVTATTGGVGNPIVSTIEDAISLFMTILALVAPVVILAVLILGPFLIFRWISRRRKQRAVSGA